MLKSILFLIISLMVVENTIQASVYKAKKYIDGEISAEEYIDSLGVPNPQTLYPQ